VELDLGGERRCRALAACAGRRNGGAHEVARRPEGGAMVAVVVPVASWVRT
jgi:hypothetical protein